MGDSPTNTVSLKDRLVQSSKTSLNKPNATMPNIVHTANTADKITNELPSTAQYSDNDINNDAIKNTDSNIYNHDLINVANSIQSASSDNPTSQKNYNTESNKYFTGKKSFAEISLNTSLPKKEHAIVFDSIDNIPQIEYIIAISKLIPPKNIKFVSRISNNRFCIYLNDKNTVDFLIDNHTNISLNDQMTIKIRRLINPAKRIIISNVSPAIPNEDIISYLKSLNIQIVSPITHINAGFNIAELAHILSFRRQVYINPDDFQKLPSSLLINHENTPHRIFLSDDTLFCYICKLKGHTSKQCKNPPLEAHNTKMHEAPIYNEPYSNPNATDDKAKINEPIGDIFGDQNSDINSLSAPRTLSQSSILDAPLELEVLTDDNTATAPNTTSMKKRPALTSTSSSLTIDSPPPTSSPQDTTSNEITPSNSKSTKTPQPATKKIKRNKSVENLITQLDELLEPAKTRFEEIPNKKINYEQFKFIIENSIGVSNPDTVLNNFNITSFEMIEYIEIIKSKIRNQGIKNRLTRLCTALLDKALSSE